MDPEDYSPRKQLSDPILMEDVETFVFDETLSRGGASLFQKHLHGSSILPSYQDGSKFTFATPCSPLSMSSSSFKDSSPRVLSEQYRSRPSGRSFFPESFETQQTSDANLEYQIFQKEMGSRNSEQFQRVSQGDSRLSRRLPGIRNRRKQQNLSMLELDMKPSCVSRISLPDRTKFEQPSGEDLYSGFSGNFECSSPAYSISSVDIEAKVSHAYENEDLGKSEKCLFKDFEDWLVLNGAQFPNLYLKSYSDDVRGVHAKRSIESYQTILSIPFNCLITDHMGKTETAIGRQVFNSDCELSTPNLIAVILYILTTRNDPANFFQPYYRILPKSYTNFPIFWGEEKLQWLKGSPLLEDIAERKRNMRADYNELCRVCPEFEQFSFAEFLEVRTAVGSRNFGIVIGGQKRTAMVPFADMLNHFRPRETSWTYENSKGAFTITSISPIPIGQQVMDSYGKKCNSKFFLHYGFAVERNREEDGKCQNEIPIKLILRRKMECSSPNLSSPSGLQFPSAEAAGAHSARRFRGLAGISTSEDLCERKLLLLSDVFGLMIQSGVLVTKTFRLSMNIEDRSTSEAMGFLRVKTAREDELAHISAIDRAFSPRHFSHFYTSKSRECLIPFVSRLNEARMLENLASVCHQQLKKYPQNYEQNQELLNSGNIKPFTDRRTALIVVLGEQEILLFWIYVAQKLCPILSSTVDSDQVVFEKLMSFKKGSDRENDLARYAFFIADKMKLKSP